MIFLSQLTNSTQLIISLIPDNDIELQLVIIGKEFLKQPKSLSFLKNLDLETFKDLVKLYSTKVNLLHML